MRCGPSSSTASTWSCKPRDLALQIRRARSARPHRGQTLTYILRSRAYGKGGELSFLLGYDPLMQGFNELRKERTEHGLSRVCAPVTDLLTGIWAVMGALSALLVRKDTGKGSAIDVSLMESGMPL